MSRFERGVPVTAERIDEMADYIEALEKLVADDASAMAKIANRMIRRYSREDIQNIVISRLKAREGITDG